MAYRTGDRYQLEMLPPSIEEYVAHDDPVRAYDAFVEALDLEQLGIIINPHKTGNPAYEPRSMLKLLVYGYSYGIRSSRKLERELHHNLAFIWLMGGLKPDFKTIAEFRRKNKKALHKVLKQCARMCLKLELIAGNVLFVDGAKIRANASSGRSHDKGWYERQLKKVDKRIKQLLDQCEVVDQQEEHLGSFVSMDKELSRSETLRDAIQDALEAFQETDRTKINQSDPDCADMQSTSGAHASYNVQSVVDDENSLIVHTEAVSDRNDRKQFARQVQQANEVLETKCCTACADSGYASTDELEKIDSEGIEVVVPTQQQESGKAEAPFAKQQFTYDPDNDCYYCPQGHQLSYVTTDTKLGKKYYQITDKRLCFECPHWGQCTDNKKSGRRVGRLKNEDVKEKLEAHYKQASSQEIYARRKTRVEHPFGHIKRNLKVTAFLLRGCEGVQAETSLLATCFNVARMITLLGGVAGFRERLKALPA